MDVKNFELGQKVLNDIRKTESILAEMDSSNTPIVKVVISFAGGHENRNVMIDTQASDIGLAQIRKYYLQILAADRHKFEEL